MSGNDVPGLMGSLGLVGYLALLVGLTVLVLGLLAAARRSGRGVALALLAAAAVPYLLGSVGTNVGQMAAQETVMMLGPAVTPKDIAAGQRLSIASATVGTLATVLALCGAIAALARSDP